MLVSDSDCRNLVTTLEISILCQTWRYSRPGLPAAQVRSRSQKGRRAADPQQELLDRSQRDPGHGEAELEESDERRVSPCQVPTNMAISRASMTVGFSSEITCAIIDHYATRNKLLHSNLVRLIESGIYHTLGKLLHDDFCNVPLVVAPAKGVQSELMIVRDPDEPHNHETWVPSAHILKLRKDLKGPNPPNEDEVNKEINETTVKGMKKRLRDAEKEKLFVEQLEFDFGLILGTPTIKRVASAQLNAELMRNKRMRLDWSKLMNLVKGTKKMSDVYQAEYRKLGAPPL